MQVCKCLLGELSNVAKLHTWIWEL